MDEKVLKLKTPQECERFERNARKLGRNDLADEAKRRSVELRADSHSTNSEAERDCWAAIYAYEEILSAKHGRRILASRTRQMINRHGVIGATERAVNRPDETVGYKALREAGLEEFAFEVVVVKYSSLFSKEAVERSRERISSWIS